MKYTNQLAAGFLTLMLAACGSADENAAHLDAAEAEPATEMRHDDAHSHGVANADTVGHGAGVILSVSSQGNSVTIDHGPIAGVDMGAMTMSFGVMGDVDLTGYAENDQVAFMIKRGRDDSYRITAICDTDLDGADCLSNLRDH